ncbi:hypothetical protein [Veronia pacifica]|uniref:Uncharacterized protein n=1 Tax=Veronia pacifica TaxID=1080227 RepID=A0A1C3E722_9GAMM|nr:hypothetical protein [Veronia pacifica]ODA29031.1 hypothetical protein A8L45_22800 [Veronia pacifica]
MNDLTQDALASLRELPESLLNEIPILLVNRKGQTDDAYMRVKNITGFVEPDRNYQLGLGMFELTENTPEIKNVEPSSPLRCKVVGEWKQLITANEGEQAANILGDYGRFYLSEDTDNVEIPVSKATRGALSYYGCQLVRVGEFVRFGGDSALPVTITSVGRSYVDGYLMHPNLGAGAYLEVHNRPHFHMPLDNKTKGALILGKKRADDVIELSAFTIPLGYGVYTPPWVIHADSHLIGNYMVVFSRTEHYSTVLVRRQNNELASIRLTTATINNP